MKIKYLNGVQQNKSSTDGGTIPRTPKAGVRNKLIPERFTKVISGSKNVM